MTSTERAVFRAGALLEAAVAVWAGVLLADVVGVSVAAVGLLAAVTLWVVTLP